MTLDQKIQVWLAIGTWVAGLGTLAAVIVALYLARRVEKVLLKALVAQIYTSVGQTVEVHPENELLEELKKAVAE